MHQPYDLVNEKFKSLPPEIRLGMTQKELDVVMAENPWYRESADHRIYPLTHMKLLMLIAIALIYPLLYDGT